MAQEPRDGDGGGGHSVDGCQLAELGVELGVLLASEVAALKGPVLEGGPALDGDLVDAAEVERAAVAVDGLVAEHVDVHAGADGGGVGGAHLQLVRHEGLAHAGLEELDLVGTHVAHAKVADLARGLELVEGGRHLFGLHERIWAVEQEDVQVIRLQALEDAVDRAHDVVVREVVAHARPDAALALENDLVTGCAART